MAGQNTISYKIKPEIEVNAARNSIDAMKKALEGMNPNSSGYKEIEKGILQAEKALNTFEAKSKQTITGMNDVKGLEKEWGKVTTKITEVGGAFDRLSKKSGEDLKKLFPAEVAKNIEKANKEIKNFGKLREELENKKDTISADYKSKKQKVTTAKAQRTRFANENNQYGDFDKKGVVAGRKAYLEGERNKYNAEIRNNTGAQELLDKQKTGGTLTKEEIDKVEQYKKSLEGLTSVKERLENIKAFEDKTAALKKAQTEAEKAKVAYDGIEKELKDIGSSNEAKRILNELGNALKNLPEAQLKKIKEDLKGIDFNNLQTEDVDRVVIALNKLETEAGTDLAKAMRQGKTSVEQFGQGAQKTKGQLDQVQQEVEQLTQSASEMAGLRSRMIQFFSITNVINLFKRAVREAYQAVKEIDAAMTETAVVTDFSVGDLWDRMPYYTEQADKLHSTITDVVKAETLYYQQGLKSAQVTELSAETLKMAKIAGMDAAEATDRMTAALRGFNMELNEDSAQRVNDVYSKLAAITAADTDEISNAMTKTASIANNANMEFETTAAFLSQIIETTRESAETAGTAMKTVIARFQELKKDPSEIGEVDGETVDANKIETALRSVGVALRDEVTGQFRDLDDVFLELAKKWDSLDTNTQRYIATIAAGSRQQSRFIAMMSNYERTMELVDAANNSAGASQQQFEKTSESLEAKLNKLKTAWQEFTTGIMNSELIKAGVDLLTSLLKTVNGLTGGFDSLSGSVMKLGLAFGGLKVGKKLLLQLTAGSALKGGLGRLMYQGSSAEALQGVVNSNKLKSQTLLGSYFGKSAKQARGNANLKTRWGQFFNESVSIRKTIGQTGGQDAVKQLQIGLQSFNAESLKSVENQEKLRQVLQQNNVTGKEATRVVNQMSKGTFQLSEANVSAIKTNKSMVKGWGKLGLWAAAILAVVGAYAALKAIMNAVDKANYTAEERIDDLTKANEQLNDRLSEVNEELDNLAEKKQAYKDLQKETDKLSKGTAEWSQNAAKLNTQFNEVLAKYPKLMENQANYTTENGYMEITAEGWNAYNDYLLDSQAQTTKMLAANNYQLADAQADAKRNQLGFSTSAITLKEQNNTKTAGWIGGVGGGVAAGLGTAAAMTAAGAAAGSVVPVVGTIVGAVVGLIVGAAVTFVGTEISKWGEDAEVIDNQLQTLADAGFIATGDEEADKIALESLKQQGLIGDINSKILEEMKENTQILNENLDARRQKTIQQEAMSHQEGMSLANELGYTGDAAELFAMTYQDEKKGTEYLYERARNSINLGSADKKVKAKDDETLELIKEYADMMGYTYSAGQQAFIDANGQKLDIVGSDIIDELTQLKYLKQIEKNTKQAFERKYANLDSDSLSREARLKEAIRTGDAGELTLRDVNEEKEVLRNQYYDVKEIKVSDRGKEVLKSGWDSQITKNQGAAAPTTTRGQAVGDPSSTPNIAINLDDALSIAHSFGFGLEKNENIQKEISKALEESESGSLSDEQIFYIIKPYLEKAAKLEQELDLLAQERNPYFQGYGFDNIQAYAQAVSKYGFDDTVSVARVAKLEQKDFDNSQISNIKNVISALPKDLEQNEQTTLYNTFIDAIDSQNIADLQSYIGLLRLTGKVTAENEAEYAALVQTTKDVIKDWGLTAEEITNRLRSIKNVQEEIEKMRTGESYEISKEMHDTLVTQFGQHLDDFVQTLDGYKFVGSIQDLENAVRDATIELAKSNIVDNKEQQQNKQLFNNATKNTVRGEGADPTAKTTIKRDGVEQDVSVEWLMGEVAAGRATTEDQAVLAKYFYDNKSKFTKQQLESLGFKYDEKGNLIDDTSNAEFLTKFTGQIANVYEAKDYDPEDTKTKNIGIAEQVLSTMSVQDFEDFDWKKEGFGDLDLETEIKPAEWKVIYSKLQDAGLSEQFGDDWTDLKNSDEATKQKAKALAIQVEQNEELDRFNKTLDENSEILQTTNEEEKKSPAYKKAANKVQNEIEGIFNVEMTDDFFNKNILEFADDLAAGGDRATEAWAKVVRKMAELALQTDEVKKLNLTAEQTASVLDSVSGIHDCVVSNNNEGANKHYATLIAALLPAFPGKPLNAIDMADSILKKSGITISGGHSNVTYDSTSGQYSYTDSATNQTVTTSSYEDVIEGKTFTSTEIGGTNKTRETNNGGSSNKWENPYDKFYNLNKDLEALQRKRNKLEREYDRLLEKGNSTIKERIDNIAAQEANLKADNVKRQEIIDERMAERNSLVNATQGYAWIDENGEVKVDWQKLNGISDNEQGNAIKEAIDKLEENVESVHEEKEGLEENTDALKELETTVRDNYIDAANSAMEALVHEREQEIEELQKINDTINDANTKLMNSIRSNLDKMRQERENDKTKEELREKENRLAYMKADTSGMYATEILKLEKELQEGRESYTDTLIDQRLQEMEEQNQKASDQRQAQIDIMTSQLEFEKETGKLWGVIAGYMVTAFTKEGAFNWDSDIGKLLYDQMGLAGMSEEERKKIKDETASSMVNYGVGDSKGYEVVVGTGGKVPIGQKEQPQIQPEQPKVEEPKVEYYDGSNVKKNETSIVDGLLAAGEKHVKLSDRRKIAEANGISNYNGTNKQNGKMLELLKQNKLIKAYKTGGLNTETGLAWLDGTTSNPELVLNARDTKNFLLLKDVLSDALGKGNIGTSQTIGESNVEININVEKIDSEVDIDEMAYRIKKIIVDESMYRNPTTLSRLR